MTDQEFIIAPAAVQVHFEILPLDMILNSIYILNQVGELSGLGEWVERTSKALSPERKAFNKIILWMLEGFYEEPPAESFPAFLAAAQQVDPEAARDATIGSLAKKYAYYGIEDGEIDPEAMLNDHAYFRDVINRTIVAKHSEKGMDFDDSVFDRMFDLLQDPQAMKAAVIDHLTYLWEEHLRDEWERNLPMLEETVAAFRQVDFTSQSVMEAIRQVTGRDMREYWSEEDMKASAVTFVPSVHIGPYNAYFERDNQIFIFFGARMPKGYTQPSHALGRSELLVRLNALADDTRLTILELLKKHQELCAQDIIEMLDLSQSSASRHLRQLTATGYLTERRRDVAKCYSLNMERVDDTLQALKKFLKG